MNIKTHSRVVEESYSIVHMKICMYALFTCRSDRFRCMYEPCRDASKALMGKLVIYWLGCSSDAECIIPWPWKVHDDVNRSSLTVSVARGPFLYRVHPPPRQYRVFAKIFTCVARTGMSAPPSVVAHPWHRVTGRLRSGMSYLQETESRRDRSCLVFSASTSTKHSCD